jgi:HK97 family phage major capsid protein
MSGPGRIGKIPPEDPPTLCGRPYVLSEYAPNDFSTDEYIAIIGDFNYYWIVDALSSDQIQVLKELYSASNQTGFICRLETDAVPVVANALSRIKLG